MVLVRTSPSIDIARAEFEQFLYGELTQSMLDKARLAMAEDDKGRAVAVAIRAADEAAKANARSFENMNNPS
jgi:hypothetical protein